MEKLKMFVVQEPVVASSSLIGGVGSRARQIHMGTEEPKDPFKDVEWKAVGGDMQNNPGDKTVIKKRRPKKLREIPDFYFLPRRSLPYNIAFYGAFIAGGIGAGMLMEIWINKKVKVQMMEELYGNFDKEINPRQEYCSWALGASVLASHAPILVSSLVLFLHPTNH